METKLAIFGAALHAAIAVGAWPTPGLAAPLDLSTAPAGGASPRAAGDAPQTTTRTAASIASSRSARLDSALFAVAYDATHWSGSVTGYKILGTSARLDAAGLWGDLPAAPATAAEPAKPARPQSTATRMDAHDGEWPAARLVLSARTADSAGSMVGISWEWPALSQAQQTALKTVDGRLDTRPEADATARDRMAYVRGDRSKEQSASPAGPFRTRASRQGDIVNSKPWYLAGKPSNAYALEDYAGFRSASSSRAPMLYVGGNDGMLHGFDAASGEEKIAYLPEGLHPKLESLTNPGYRHAYFVDGSPLGGDLYLGPPGSRDASRWRTYLAGFLGAGGKGYFVLDITDPRAFDAANAAALVVLDRTGTDAMDRDIGHILSEPVMEAGDPSISRQITRMNDGRWALVMGNGYNSADEKAVLLIQYLDMGKELVKITADARAGRGNGLSAPRLIDLDGDGTPDLAYAGDLLGNLWKFDLRAASPAEWKLAFSGVPFFVATDGTPAGSVQAITSAPVWKAHPEGGLMLAFGTGRELTVADRLDGQVQTVYGVHDDTAISRATPAQRAAGAAALKLDEGKGPVAGGRGQLVAQTVSAGTVSSNPVHYTGSEARRGWLLDLPVARERVLHNPDWFEGDLIDVWSTVPASADGDLAASAAKSYRTTLDIINGSAPKSRLYADTPSVAAGQASRVEAGLGVGIRSATKEIGVNAPGMPAPATRHRLGRITKRPSWRQLQ